jgi:hypothetical protein
VTHGKNIQRKDIVKHTYHHHMVIRFGTYNDGIKMSSLESEGSQKRLHNDRGLSSPIESYGSQSILH